MKQSLLNLVIFLFFCMGSVVPVLAQTDGATEADTKDEQPDAVEVQAATIEKMDLYRSVFYGSRLRPRQKHPQRTPIAGTIETIEVSEGETVRRGQLLARVRRDLSGRNYKSVEITADRSGTVGRYDLQPGDPVQEKQHLLSILDTSSLRGEIWVSDKDIVSVRTGDEAVIFEGPNPTDIRGKVFSIPPEPDYESGLFKVEVEFRPQPGLFVGKFVRIELRKDPYSGLAVSSEHIQRKYGKDHLFIVNNGVVELREVQTGASYDELVTIESGVRAGEQYVVSAGQRISDGTPVKIAEGGE